MTERVSGKQFRKSFVRLDFAAIQFVALVNRHLKEALCSFQYALFASLCLRLVYLLETIAREIVSRLRAEALEEYGVGLITRGDRYRIRVPLILFEGIP